jgi:hypothetical protein
VHTATAAFWYTFELISVAVPRMKSPPPCKQKQASGITFIGAMDESSRTVKKVSIRCQPDSSRRWCRSALPCRTQQVLHPVPGKASTRNVFHWSHWGDQALTYWDAQESRARAQQPVSSRASSRGPWRNCHRRFKMQTLTFCDAKITSTRTAAGQFKVVQWRNGGYAREGSKCKHSQPATPKL